MEEEERAAQSAKLQELIRRGNPRDLQEANKLMKVMAGYDTRNKTDYRAKAAEEVAKIQQKAKLLEEMLQGHKSGDDIKDGDVFEVIMSNARDSFILILTIFSQELASALQNAHPKIQKMCEEESEDHEAVAKLLEINDSIHRTIERYKLIKKGDLEGAAKIPKGTLGTSGAGVSTGSGAELSLIDLGGPEDDTPESKTKSATTMSDSQTSALEDDLLGLDISQNSFGAGGGISLGNNSQSGIVALIVFLFSRTNMIGIINASVNPTPPQSIIATNTSGNADPFASLDSKKPLNNQPSSIASVPSHNISSQHTLSANPSGSIPSILRQASPQPFQQSIAPSASTSTSTSASLLDLTQSGSQKSNQPSGSNSTEEEWTFASALPAKPNQITVLNSSIYIVFDVNRVQNMGSDVLIQSRISNNAAQHVSDLTSQFAVTKVRGLDHPVLHM